MSERANSEESIDDTKKDIVSNNNLTKPTLEEYSKEKKQWILEGEKDDKIHAWFIEHKRKNKLLFWKNKEWIKKNMREHLHYKSTPLRTYALKDKKEKNYPLLYNQVCDTWRQLVDVRFKLLGLVPAISAALIYSIVSSDQLNKFEAGLIAVIGFLITFGIYIYDRRNSELHDQLISRGRKIEEEMGVDNGVFMGRKKSSKYVIPIPKYPLIKIQHGTGLGLIYWTTLLIWIHRPIMHHIFIILWLWKNNI